MKRPYLSAMRRCSLAWLLPLALVAADCDRPPTQVLTLATTTSVAWPNVLRDGSARGGGAP